jgi:hypothetical protein
MPLSTLIVPGCFISARSPIQFVEWALVMGFEAGMLFGVYVTFKKLAKPLPGILLLMSIKAYQTRQHLLIIYISQFLIGCSSPKRLHFRPHSPGLRGWYGYFFRLRNPCLTISSGILYYIALFGKYMALNYRVLSLIFSQLSR